MGMADHHDSGGRCCIDRCRRSDLRFEIDPVFGFESQPVGIDRRFAHRQTLGRPVRRSHAAELSAGGTVSRVTVEDSADDVNDDQADAGPDRVEPDKSASGSASRRRSAATSSGDKLPIKMLNDRILVQLEGPDGERKSTGGILIPATAQVGKRLAWAEVVAVGPSVRTMELGDRVLFNPEDRYEVEVGGSDYIILRERDIHAVAAERLDDSHTGLYL